MLGARLARGLEHQNKYISALLEPYAITYPYVDFFFGIFLRANWFGTLNIETNAFSDNKYDLQPKLEMHEHVICNPILSGIKSGLNFVLLMTLRF